MNKDSATIGTPGIPWGDAETTLWRQRQTTKRAYTTEVLQQRSAVPIRFVMQQYGELNNTGKHYPLMGFISADWQHDRPTILITGGVHGYETSGVQGAMRFLIAHADEHSQDFNFAIAPCISPWGYETINRWNASAIDPNRSFVEGSSCDESAKLMAWVASLPGEILAHFDLHETTDTDNSEFRPALAARDATEQDVYSIPDGFYLVGDSQLPAPDFQRAIIQSVERVTHIASADDTGLIIGVPIEQHGVINYDVARLGLCAGLTQAPFKTTTEVYPDSSRVDAENCTQAQVAAICGGIHYLKRYLNG
tara:strand:- start:158 stop:1081 length:924 start_codon:yes stop_codon:yes gene_type:complete